MYKNRKRKTIYFKSCLVDTNNGGRTTQEISDIHDNDK